jgi:hypothetical protein
MWDFATDELKGSINWFFHSPSIRGVFPVTLDILYVVAYS